MCVSQGLLWLARSRRCATEGRRAIGCMQTKLVSAAARACREGRLVHNTHSHRHRHAPMHAHTHTHMDAQWQDRLFISPSFSPALPPHTVASELRGQRGRQAAMVTDDCGGERRGPWWLFGSNGTISLAAPSMSACWPGDWTGELCVWRRECVCAHALCSRCP